MRIAFDIDGTLTNFEKFIIDNRDYIEEKYKFELKNYYGYDVDQMFDLEAQLIKLGLSKEQAKIRSDRIMKDFWNRFYFKYCMSNFRDGVKETINKLINDGDEVFIVSSRKKTCDKDIIGKLVKCSTILKFKMNNIKSTKIVFFPSDDKKIEYIKQNNMDIVVDDKPEIIGEISKDTKCICINSNYNMNDFNENVERADSFDNNIVYSLISKIKNEFLQSEKIAKIKKYLSLEVTERNYKIVRTIGTPFVNQMFHPIILNKQNISEQKPLIYAPNHRKTLDPYFIMMSSEDAIHWNALKRFFDGEDSIFNNSKNPFLCQLTSYIFKNMGFIPVNRGSSNIETIEKTNYCLKNGSCVGIFPEGTTNKNPDIQELLEIKKGILHFAKENNVLIQPVSIVWFPASKKIKNKVVINYRPPFSMNDLTIEEGRQKWIDSILSGIDENKEIIDETINQYVKVKK